MKVLVMGGTQFNGLALVRELVRSGHDVTILNRGKSAGRGAARRAPPRRGPHRPRLDAARARARGLRLRPRRERVPARRRRVHDRAAARPRRPLRVRQLDGDLRRLATCCRSTRTHPVDRSPRQNEYGRNKLLCEDLLVRAHREHGFPATTVALSMVFGPHNILPDREQRMFVRLAAGPPDPDPGRRHHARAGRPRGRPGARAPHADGQARAPSAAATT